MAVSRTVREIAASSSGLLAMTSVLFVVLVKKFLRKIWPDQDNLCLLYLENAMLPRPGKGDKN